MYSLMFTDSNTPMTSATPGKNYEQRSRNDIALANQNLISVVTGMKHTWNQRKYSDHAMVTVVVDFEIIDKGYSLMSLRASSRR